MLWTRCISACRSTLAHATRSSRSAGAEHGKPESAACAEYPHTPASVQAAAEQPAANPAEAPGPVLSPRNCGGLIKWRSSALRRGGSIAAWERVAPTIGRVQEKKARMPAASSKGEKRTSIRAAWSCGTERRSGWHRSAPVVRISPPDARHGEAAAGAAPPSATPICHAPAAPPTPTPRAIAPSSRECSSQPCRAQWSRSRASMWLVTSEAVREASAAARRPASPQGKYRQPSHQPSHPQPPHGLPTGHPPRITCTWHGADRSIPSDSAAVPTPADESAGWAAASRRASAAYTSL
mmetsp:Transcript_34176/g.110404  ORF Transcript_34176/g.110404 Transcript_34176/m.110404 type:complete len:295 (-) Transcript_34176:2853-3737(-)